MPFNKGDILTGSRTGHPIIYLQDIDQSTFSGLIITHSNNKRYPDNTELQSQHFESIDADGRQHEILFDDSFVVKKCLIKRMEWGPFTNNNLFYNRVDVYALLNYTYLPYYRFTSGGLTDVLVVRFINILIVQYCCVLT